MALISCLSIFNPENLSSKLVSPADEKDLSLNKEIIFNILRILTREKYPKSHYRRLAALVSIISELQAFHMNNMTTWEKFLTFKVSQSPEHSLLTENKLVCILMRLGSKHQFENPPEPFLSSSSETARYLTCFMNISAKNCLSGKC